MTIYRMNTSVICDKVTTYIDTSIYEGKYMADLEFGYSENDVLNSSSFHSAYMDTMKEAIKNVFDMFEERTFEVSEEILAEINETKESLLK